jgi:hypothetical protein
LQDAVLNMTAALEMRDLAHCLLTYEAGMGKTSDPTESGTLRVYEKLRQSLVEFVGVAGFHSLASRALTLARPEAPSLGAVRIASDGSLLGLGQRLGECQGENATQVDMDTDLAGEVGIFLIVRLLELLRVFLGEALTLSLLRNAWPGEVFDDGNVVNGRKA